MAESNNNELIGFIATTVETIRDRVDGIEVRMATKSDINRLEIATTAIRGDIEQVQLRLDGMEHSITSRFEHVEGELSLCAVPFTC